MHLSLKMLVYFDSLLVVYPNWRINTEIFVSTICNGKIRNNLNIQQQEINYGIPISRILCIYFNDANAHMQCVNKMFINISEVITIKYVQSLEHLCIFLDIYITNMNQVPPSARTTGCFFLFCLCVFSKAFKCIMYYEIKFFFLKEYLFTDLS